MALPSNTVVTYAITGIREDLSDMIYDVSPSATPFYSTTKKGKAKATYHEWQTDALRAAADNAHLEGDDTTADAQTATTRLGNRTQIFKNAVVASDTEAAVDQAGRSSEMARDVLKTAKEQKLDIERALFLNQAAVTGAAGVARKLAGVPSWLTTNTSVGGTGADPVTIGTTARTDGTQRAFTQALFEAVMQTMWDNGAEGDTVYLSSFQMAAAQGFTGNNNQQSMIDAADKKVIKHMAVYVTPWGTVTFKPSRLHRSRDVFIMDSKMWEIPVLRPTKNTPLAKTGDNEKRQVVTELTLKCNNEAAHGAVYDCTTS